MANRIYALLVGINDYAPEVGKLSGCLNDVDHFHEYLTGNFDTSALAIEVLKDADATRDNLIKQFRGHLGKAQADDVAVFHYCGHGARWASAGAFREFYPDGKDEGLVCIDSRRPGGFDLADKELAVLISEVAKNHPHIAVILDCCHSGSGTRDVDAFRGLKPRLTHEVYDERPLESYLDGHFVTLRQRNERLFIPASKHILMAACERTQLAQENPADRSGIFTSTLLEVLGKSGRDMSYAELFVSCRAAVRRRAENQHPQFEAYGNFNSWSGFLGRAGAERRRKLVNVNYDQGSWTIDRGAIHGLPTEPEKSVGLIVYPASDQSRVAGNALTTVVGPQKSALQLDFSADTSASYVAEITSLPVPPLPIYVEGDGKIKRTLEEALAKDGTVNASLTDIAEGSHYALSVEDGTLWLKQRDTSVLIQGVTLNPQNPEASAALMVSIVKHVVRWEKSLSLQNHRTQMDPSAVDFVFEEVNEDGSAHLWDRNEITLDFVKSGNEWKKITGRFKVRNQSGQTLHIIFAHFSSAYGITVFSNEPVDSGGQYVTLPAVDGKPEVAFDVEEGASQFITNLKLIVSTEKVDDFLLTQDDLEIGRLVSGTRGMKAATEVKKYKNEWFTKSLRIKVVRQLDQVGPSDAALAQGKIVVKSHPKIKANLSLAAAALPGRSAGVVPTRSAGVVPTRSVEEGSDFYKEFERHDMKMVNFFEGTRGEAGNILELTDIKNAETLQEAPLELEVNIPLNDDQGILPFVFDGQHVILGGDTFKDEEGKTHISINHIPDVPHNRRSLGGSLKLYFFKTYLKREHVNRLRWVEDASEKEVKYREDSIAEKVASAKNIILLVHGIIGDTEAMAKGLWMTRLNSKFDLVLTYDYENLTTPIEDTARKLKQDLFTCGLKEADNKNLTLLVHSMGGLVSRWFIEREGGKGIVDHLVMCGTPNNGSPFGHVDSARKIMSILTGLAATYLPFMIPFSGPLLFLLNRSKNITPTLEEMNPQSPFIHMLNESEDPGVRYTVLAGNIVDYQEPSDQFFPKFLEKAGKGALVDLIFGTDAHDIAVRDDSILTIDDARTPAPKKSNVACHHLNYFLSEAGQKALTDVAW